MSGDTTGAALLLNGIGNIASLGTRRIESDAGMAGIDLIDGFEARRDRARRENDREKRDWFAECVAAFDPERSYQPAEVADIITKVLRNIRHTKGANQNV